MKIKKSQLQKLIQEEYKRVLQEQQSSRPEAIRAHAQNLRDQYLAVQGHCDEFGCNDQQYEVLNELEQELAQAEEFAAQIDAADAYGRAQYEQFGQPDQPMMTADTTPRDYEGLNSAVASFVPFGETAARLLDPTTQGFPSREQVVSDIGWETLGAGLPFVPGQKLKRGWEWLQSRLRDTPRRLDPVGSMPGMETLPGMSPVGPRDPYGTSPTVQLYPEGVPEHVPRVFGDELPFDPSRRMDPDIDPLTHEISPLDAEAIRRGVPVEDLDSFDRAMVASEASRTVAMDPEEAAAIRRAARIGGPAHAAEVIPPGSARHYGGGGAEGPRAVGIGGDVHINPVFHPPAPPAPAPVRGAPVTPRSGGERPMRLDQKLDIEPPEGSGFGTDARSGWRRHFRPANIARAGLGLAGLGAGLEYTHHHDMTPDWGFGPWADDMNRFLDTSPTFGMAGSEAPYSERAEHDAIMDAARDAGAYERERRGLFGGGPWDLTRYFRDPVARDVPVEGYEGGSGTQDFQPGSERSPRLSGESRHVWHTPAGGYQPPVPGTGQFGEQEELLDLQESRSNEGSIESLCNMIDEEVNKLYKK